LPQSDKLLCHPSRFPRKKAGQDKHYLLRWENKLSPLCPVGEFSLFSFVQNNEHNVNPRICTSAAEPWSSNKRRQGAGNRSGFVEVLGGERCRWVENEEGQER